jgi:hypothetical protein
MRPSGLTVLGRGSRSHDLLRDARTSASRRSRRSTMLRIASLLGLAMHSAERLLATIGSFPT